ncbi:hypothetical protein Mapa_012241 [Marchantia paleacea]|nr:hypothetical protein Mapa_012241 [Marchantia paleacea]
MIAVKVSRRDYSSEDRSIELLMDGWIEAESAQVGGRVGPRGDENGIRRRVYGNAVIDQGKKA